LIEIERKFLVISDVYKNEASIKERITQGFLNTAPERTVRVRIKGELGYITVKGITNESGMSRFEWEKEISLHEANALLKLCEEGIVDKIRHNIRIGNHIYEVDEFFGSNQGLVVAEIELKSEDEFFEIPSWLGKEVTGAIKYYNSQLGKNPYSKW